MNEGDKSQWALFYQTLNRIGPRLLKGIHPELKEWVTFISKESDDFWSESLHADYWLWEEGNCIEAARNALIDWAFNVKEHLKEILGDDSLIPFDKYGISPTKRRQLESSIEDIQLKLDKNHLSIFIDSIRLNYISDKSPPTLLIKEIITPYADSSDGKLIHALAVPWQMIIKQLNKDWKLAYQIPYTKWEELVAAAFDQAGYDEVILTPRSGDHGRDVIAIKKGIGSVKIIDSVKAYKPGHLVSYDDVRALAGVLLGDLQASKGIITTTSEFAPGITKDPFLKPLMPFRIELMNGKALQKWLEDLALS